MMSHKVLLFRVECHWARRIGRIDAHAVQRRNIGNRRDEQFAILLETNETTVEEVIGSRSKHQAVGFVQALFVR